MALRYFVLALCLGLGVSVKLEPGRPHHEKSKSAFPLHFHKEAVGDSPAGCRALSGAWVPCRQKGQHKHSALEDDASSALKQVARLALPATIEHDTQIMVTVPRARLGNRLFEIAALLSIAKAANAYAVIPDYKYNPQNTPQLSKLGALFMNYTEVWAVTDPYENKCHIWDRLPLTVDGNQSKVLQWTLPGQPHGTIHNKADAPTPGVNEDWAKHWANAIHTTRAGTTPCYVTEVDGFYQRNEYFQSDVHWIRELFWHEESAEQGKAILDDIVGADKTAVAVHLRLGDYVITNRNLDMAYYHEALKTVQDRNVGKPLTCVIFSDDISLAMEMSKNLTGCSELVPVEAYKGKLAGTRYQPNGWKVTDQISFYMMSQLRNIIIADSTYSFWAARLARDEPLVITPLVNTARGSAYEYLMVPGWVNIPATTGMASNPAVLHKMNLNKVDNEVALSEWGA